MIFSVLQSREYLLSLYSHRHRLTGKDEYSQVPAIWLYLAYIEQHHAFRYFCKSNFVLKFKWIEQFDWKITPNWIFWIFEFSIFSSGFSTEILIYTEGSNSKYETSLNWIHMLKAAQQLIISLVMQTFKPCKCIRFVIDKAPVVCRTTHNCKVMLNQTWI